jgi:4'-phosphopantetheinyl transferase
MPPECLERTAPERHGSVHVLCFSLDSFEPYCAELTALLDRAERARAARWVLERDRTRYVIAHALMRQVLGSSLDVPPSTLQFDVGPHGKPRLREAPFDLRFNLTHSGEQALLAVALGREVGIDIEAERPIDELALARRFFSPAEYAALAAVPDRRAAFFRCWTRKESFVKARGDGLSFPLDGFDVGLEPQAEQLLMACRAAPAELARWTTRAVCVGSGFAAALTAEGRDWRIVQRRVSAMWFREPLEWMPAAE